MPASSLMSPDISVVIPIYNEDANLDELYRELTDVLGAWPRGYEIILVDDGSSDKSFEILERIQRRDGRVRVIQCRRKFGQTAAFAAGFAEARGRLVVTSDGDLQNDPRDIPAMVKHLDEGGFDIVCGWRRNRQDPWLNRRLPSSLANRLISWTTGVRLNDYGCSLKVFRSEVVKPLRLYGELHRFLPALASENGVRIAELPVSHRARQHGRSKYGISRTLRVVLDLVTVKFLLSYATRPLQIFGLVGGAMGAAGAVLLTYLWVTHQMEERLPAVLAGILLVSTAVQLVTLGLLAELQSRTYHESQNKPIYAIRRVLKPED